MVNRQNRRGFCLKSATNKLPIELGKVKSPGPDSLLICKSQPKTTPLHQQNDTELFVITPGTHRCIRLGDLMRRCEIGILKYGKSSKSRGVFALKVQLIKFPVALGTVKITGSRFTTHL